MSADVTAKAIWTRRGLVIAALVLVVLLVALVAALLMLLSEPKPPTHTPVAGIRPVHVIYGPGVGEQPFFDNPMGAAFGNDGRVYVADTGNNRIVIFDHNGRYLSQFGRLGVAKPANDGTFSWAPGLFNYPTDVATDPDGNVYVADFNNDQIQVFDPDGKFVRAFPDRAKRVGKGASGSGGKGIAVSSVSIQGDRVYVTDRFQVLEFTTDGKLLTQFGKPGTGAADLDHPNGIVAGPASSVIVSDSNHNRIVSLTPSGKFMWAIGEPLGMDLEKQGASFQLPRGIARLDDGSYMVADALMSQLVKVSGVGKVVARYGQRGDAPGEFDFPTDVAAQGDLLVVAEKGLNRVQVISIVSQ